MKRLMIFFCLTLTVATLLLISLTSCNPCVLGDVCEAGIMQPIEATWTSAAGEWHVQQTEMAR